MHDLAALGVHRLGDQAVPRQPRAAQASLPANGASQPSMLGAMPPVTIRPTPPRARSAKYAASFG